MATKLFESICAFGGGSPLLTPAPAAAHPPRKYDFLTGPVTLTSLMFRPFWSVPASSEPLVGITVSKVTGGYKLLPDGSDPYFLCTLAPPAVQTAVVSFDSGSGWTRGGDIELLVGGATLALDAGDLLVVETTWGSGFAGIHWADLPSGEGYPGTLSGFSAT